MSALVISVVVVVAVGVALLALTLSLLARTSPPPPRTHTPRELDVGPHTTAPSGRKEGPMTPDRSDCAANYLARRLLAIFILVSVMIPLVPWFVAQVSVGNTLNAPLISVVVAVGVALLALTLSLLARTSPPPPRTHTPPRASSMKPLTTAPSGRTEGFVALDMTVLPLRTSVGALALVIVAVLWQGGRFLERRAIDAYLARVGVARGGRLERLKPSNELPLRTSLFIFLIMFVVAGVLWKVNSPLIAVLIVIVIVAGVLLWRVDRFFGLRTFIRRHEALDATAHARTDPDVTLLAAQ